MGFKWYRPWDVAEKVVKSVSREIGRVYEKQIGKTGAIKYATDIAQRPEAIAEDIYKSSPVHDIPPTVTGAVLGYVVGGPTGAVVGASAGAQYSQYKALKDMAPPPIPPMPPTLGPAPRVVMAGDRAALSADRLRKKRRRYATVMGGDYGLLNVRTEKLGTFNVQAKRLGA